MENNIINHKEKLVTDGYTIIDDIIRRVRRFYLR